MGNLIMGRLAGVSVLALLVAAEVQAATPIPAGIPGQIDPNLQRNQQELIQRQQEIEERARRIEVPALQGEASPSQELPSADERFELKGIHFNPSVFIEKSRLEAMAADYVGREISFKDINELLSKINAIYEQAGQLTARAVVPPQNVSNGVLSIVLIEAKVDGVSWQDAPQHVDESFYRDRLGITPGETLDSAALVAAISRFNSTTPGPQVSAGLAPGEAFGSTRVDLQAFEPDPLQWSLFFNNYGSESTGREQYGGSLTWFSPTGVADALNAIVVATSGSEYGSLRYSRPVNRYNGVAYVEAGTNTMSVEKGPFSTMDIEGDSTTYGIGYDQPWWVDNHWTLLGGIGYSHQTSESTIAGVPLSEVDVDEVVLKGQFEYRDGPWYGRYEQRLRQASVDNAINGEGDSYQLLNGMGYLSREVKEDYQLVGRLSWQFATDSESLPSALLYQFGGISSVRGYESGVIASPQGVTINAEGYWRYNEMLQPFVFFDYGRAMELGTSDVDLMSVGIGLNFNWGRRVSLSVVAANTLEDVTPDQDSGQLLAQLIIR
ncbi:ShlB/FhaC/HecB family hemolysin secretion/activation protein [Ectopseudomonas mendocina]|uniref:ShlB/FhaC/HecB family hemolysin secretion/activation protein n=1 Tax=Ectopseudomonas mendocina TaxID=300 RepID=A0ABZ2RHE0_ECTME